MSLPNGFGGGVIGKNTATAGTAWYALIPPYYNAGAYRGYSCLLQVNITNGNTATNFTFMRPQGATTATAAASTGVNTITLAADPGNNAGGLYSAFATNNNIAANDIIVTQNVDGTVTQYVVGAWNATTKVVTVSAANLSVNIAAGAKVWDYGVNTDNDPLTGMPYPIVPNGQAVNTTGSTFNTVAGGFRGSRIGDPLLIYCGNATNAVTLNYAEYQYSNT
jgi:hypothetical protein